jgi:hypothetical protein
MPFWNTKLCIDVAEHMLMKRDNTSFNLHIQKLCIKHVEYIGSPCEDYNEVCESCGFLDTKTNSSIYLPNIG